MELLLLIIIIFLLIIIGFTHQQIRRITKQLRSKQKITISLLNKSIENLCDSINENQLKSQEERLIVIRKEEALKQSISNISHDLRTPLTSILGYLTLLKTCKVENRVNYLAIIQQKAKMLNNLISEFYELTLQEEDTTINLKKISITDIVIEILMGSHLLITQNNINLKHNIEEANIEIFGEETICYRIIQNLLSNAIMYGDDEIIILLTSDKDNVTFSIENSLKEKMSKEDVSKLFDRFYTIDKSRSQGGSGLGLYIVKLLADKINAEIKADILTENRLCITVTFESMLL